MRGMRPAFLKIIEGWQDDDLHQLTDRLERLHRWMELSNPTDDTGAKIKMVQQHDGDDHLVVTNFFCRKGLIAEPISTAAVKTPDFKIKDGAEVVAYCEMKSPQNVFAERLNEAILPGQGGIVKTVYGSNFRQARSLKRLAQKAAKQFQAMNPKHAKSPSGDFNRDSRVFGA